MKTVVLSSLLIVIIILINCSGDRLVDNSDVYYNGVLNSLITQDNQGLASDNENGPEDIRIISYIGIVFNYNGSSYENYNKIAVAVYVYYQYYEPVPPGAPVYLRVIPDSLATIDDTVYTSLWGWAFAKLVYPAIYTSEEVQVIASCEAVADTALIILPICAGNLELTADPERLFVEQPGSYDSTAITCQLINGGGIPQRNGRIVFIALVAGQICGPTSAFTDDRGFCHTEYRIHYDDIPDGNSDPGYIKTGVRAALFGYPDVEEEISLYCYKE